MYILFLSLKFSDFIITWTLLISILSWTVMAKYIWYLLIRTRVATSKRLKNQIKSSFRNKTVLKCSYHAVYRRRLNINYHFISYWRAWQDVFMWLHNTEIFTTATTNYTYYQALNLKSQISISKGLTDFLVIIEKSLNYQKKWYYVAFI